jgi:hypothetical protein
MKAFSLIGECAEKSELVRRLVVELVGRGLVLPDDVPGHPLQTSIDVAFLAHNAQITVFP